MSRYKKTSRILSHKDDIGLSESLKLYKSHRLDPRTGLVVPIDHVDHRELHCGFCGEAFNNRPTGFYYEEKFHESCIQRMLRGETNK